MGFNSGFKGLIEPYLAVRTVAKFRDPVLGTCAAIFRCSVRRDRAVVLI